MLCLLPCMIHACGAYHECAATAVHGSLCMRACVRLALGMCERECVRQPTDRHALHAALMRTGRAVLTSYHAIKACQPDHINGTAANRMYQ